MAEPAEKKLRRATLKKRQLEIEQCLTAYGLSRGPRCVVSGASSMSIDTHDRRLRGALWSLGPVFSSFGLYLSSRVDLLPVSYCVELYSQSEAAEKTPIASIREMVHASLGGFPEDLFTRFEAEPFESQLLYQSHHAWVNGAGPVMVKVIHPGLEERIDTDLQCLPLLKEAFAGLDLKERQIDSAIDDFRKRLLQRTGFDDEIRALEVLGHDSREFTMLAAARVHKELCSSKVLTVEQLHGVRLADIVGSPDRAGVEAGVDPGNLANTIFLVWLRQALMGNVMPVEPAPANILLLPTQQIAFTGGSFTNLTQDSQTNLWNYLTSALGEDSDKTCECLLAEMERDKRPACEKELRNSFRQIVPFRDGGWSGSGGDSLAEHLFLQWRLAGSEGFRPSPDLVAFYRGLFLVAAAARLLTASRDSLQEGFENLRLIASLDQFRQMMDVRQVGLSVDKYVTMMIELPKKLDEVLTFAAEGSARVKLSIPESPERRRQKNSFAVTAALLLVMAAVILLSKYLGTDENAGRWSERIGTVLFVLIGAMLIRAASNARR